jgi:hypothetical protein
MMAGKLADLAVVTARKRGWRFTVPIFRLRAAARSFVRQNKELLAIVAAVRQCVSALNEDANVERSTIRAIGHVRHWSQPFKLVWKDFSVRPVLNAVNVSGTSNERGWEGLLLSALR